MNPFVIIYLVDYDNYNLPILLFNLTLLLPIIYN